MKNLVEEWSKQYGYTVTDVTSKQGKAPIEWALEIKNGQNAVIAFTSKNSDLLRFQTQINFSPEHQQKTASMPNVEYNEFVLNMTDRLAFLECDWNFMGDANNPKQMNGLTMVYFVIYESADKNTVLHFLSKAFINLSHMVRAISITLNKGGDPQGTSTQSNTGKSMYG